MAMQSLTMICLLLKMFAAFLDGEATSSLREMVTSKGHQIQIDPDDLDNFVGHKPKCSIHRKILTTQTFKGGKADKLV